jgi:hypothetical protein
MSLRLIKYFRGPTFTASEWTVANPVLAKGEIGYELNGSLVTAAKVGNGVLAWNDLSYLGEDIYNYVEEVTNPIGDAQGSLQGLTVAEILNKMLSPYEIPTFQNIRNNARGGSDYQNIALMEVGQVISGPVSIIYNLLNAQNLSGSTPINVTAAGVFANEGNFANSGNISLTLASPLNPSTPLTITITMKNTHLQGMTGGVDATTQIKYRARAMWVSSALTDILSGATFMSQANQQYSITDDYKQDYSFYGNGYSWIAIPSMLNPTNVIFTDVTNPNAPADYAMEAKGTLSINNGVATYNYVLYRSTYFLINPTKLRIS